MLDRHSIFYSSLSNVCFPLTVRESPMAAMTSTSEGRNWCTVCQPRAKYRNFKINVSCKNKRRFSATHQTPLIDYFRDSHAATNTRRE